MSESSEDESSVVNLPPAAECDRRCKEFAEITGTDTPLAMFFLQDRGWSVERAVNDYLESTSSGSAGKSSAHGHDVVKHSMTVKDEAKKMKPDEKQTESLTESSEDDDDEDDGGNVPSAAECEKRCQEFADITGTDTALAMFFLQDREWSVEHAVNDYMESLNMSSQSFSESQPGNTVTPSSANSKNVTTDSKNVTAVQEDSEPHRIRVLSWNIDGLDESNILTRAKAVCLTIEKEKPHVVFLQEVISKSLSLIRETCKAYQCIVGRPYSTNQPVDGEYFVAILLRKEFVEYLSHEVQPFYSSTMSRCLLQVKATVKGVPCLLMTSHLESTASHTAERQRQLKMAFEAMTKCDAHRTVIFGGDLNLRDKEVQQVGGLPGGVVDVWESTGRRPEATYTWDMQRNDNLEWNRSRFKPRCRFDRLYYRPADQLTAVYFELIGLERLTSCRRFASDHWGILSHFNKK